MPEAVSQQVQAQDPRAGEELRPVWGRRHAPEWVAYYANLGLPHPRYTTGTSAFYDERGEVIKYMASPAATRERATATPSPQQRVAAVPGGAGGRCWELDISGAAWGEILSHGKPPRCSGGARRCVGAA